jgi:hypothetical protein
MQNAKSISKFFQQLLDRTMKTERLRTIIRKGASLLLLATVSLTIGACDVTGPDTTPWENTSSFSWPIGLGKRIVRYEKTDMDSGLVVTVDTVYFDMSEQTTNEKVFAGQPMYMLDQRQGSSKHFFLPLKDTLVIFDQTPATLALVAPLEKGSSWNCAFDADNTPTWKATIVERYAYRNVEGKVYRNVIEVKYEPMVARYINAGLSWVRFFAEGVGPVQTIQLFNTLPSSPGTPAKQETIERRVLIDNTQATD